MSNPRRTNPNQKKNTGQRNGKQYTWFNKLNKSVNKFAENVAKTIGKNIVVKGSGAGKNGANRTNNSNTSNHHQLSSGARQVQSNAGKTVSKAFGVIKDNIIVKGSGYTPAATDNPIKLPTVSPYANGHKTGQQLNYDEQKRLHDYYETVDGKVELQLQRLRENADNTMYYDSCDKKISDYDSILHGEDEFAGVLADDLSASEIASIEAWLKKSRKKTKRINLDTGLKEEVETYDEKAGPPPALRLKDGTTYRVTNEEWSFLCRYDIGINKYLNDQYKIATGKKGAVKYAGTDEEAVDSLLDVLRSPKKNAFKNYVRDYFYYPIKEGNFGALGLNTLVNLGETLDFFGVGARALLAGNARLGGTGTNDYGSAANTVWYSDTKKGHATQKRLIDLGANYLIEGMPGNSHRGGGVSEATKERIEQKIKSAGLWDEYQQLKRAYKEAKDNEGSVKAKNFKAAYSDTKANFNIETGNIVADMLGYTVTDPSIVVGGLAKAGASTGVKVVSEAAAKSVIKELIPNFEKGLVKSQRKAFNQAITKFERKNANAIFRRDEDLLKSNVFELQEDLRKLGAFSVSYSSIAFKGIDKNVINVGLRNDFLDKLHSKILNRWDSMDYKILRSVQGVDRFVDLVDTTLLKASFGGAYIPYKSFKTINKTFKKQYAETVFNIIDGNSSQFLKNMARRTQYGRFASYMREKTFGDISSDTIRVVYEKMKKQPTGFDTQYLDSINDKLSYFTGQLNRTISDVHNGVLDLANYTQEINKLITNWTGGDAKNLNQLKRYVQKLSEGPLVDDPLRFRDVTQTLLKQIDDLQHVNQLLVRNESAKLYKLLKDCKSIDDVIKLAETQEWRIRTTRMPNEMKQALKLRVEELGGVEKGQFDYLVRQFERHHNISIKPKFVEAIDFPESVSTNINLPVAVSKGVSVKVAELDKLSIMLPELGEFTKLKFIYKDVSKVDPTILQEAVNNCISNLMKGNRHLEKEYDDVFAILNSINGSLIKEGEFIQLGEDVVYSRLKLSGLAHFDMLMQDTKFRETISYCEDPDTPIGKIISDYRKAGSFPQEEHIANPEIFDALGSLSDALNVLNAYHTFRATISSDAIGLSENQIYAVMEAAFSVSKGNPTNAVNDTFGYPDAFIRKCITNIVSLHGEYRASLDGARQQIRNLNEELFSKYSSELAANPALKKRLYDYTKDGHLNPQNDVKVQMLYTILKDTDAIKDYNFMNKERPVIFMDLETTGTSAANHGVTSIAFKEWKEIPEGASLSEILDILDDTSTEKMLRRSFTEEEFNAANIQTSTLSVFFKEDLSVAKGRETLKDAYLKYHVPESHFGEEVFSSEEDMITYFNGVLMPRYSSREVPSFITHSVDDFDMSFLVSRMTNLKVGYPKGVKDTQTLIDVSQNTLARLRGLEKDACFTGIEQKLIKDAFIKLSRQLVDYTDVYKYLDPRKLEEIFSTLELGVTGQIKPFNQFEKDYLKTISKDEKFLSDYPELKGTLIKQIGELEDYLRRYQIVSINEETGEIVRASENIDETFVFDAESDSFIDRKVFNPNTNSIMDEKEYLSIKSQYDNALLCIDQTTDYLEISLEEAEKYSDAIKELTSEVEALKKKRSIIEEENTNPIYKVIKYKKVEGEKPIVLENINSVGSEEVLNITNGFKFDGKNTFSRDNSSVYYVVRDTSVNKFSSKRGDIPSFEKPNISEIKHINNRLNKLDIEISRNKSIYDSYIQDCIKFDKDLESFDGFIKELNKQFPDFDGYIYSDDAIRKEITDKVQQLYEAKRELNNLYTQYRAVKGNAEDLLVDGKVFPSDSVMTSLGGKSTDRLKDSILNSFQDVDFAKHRKNIYELSVRMNTIRKNVERYIVTDPYKCFDGSHPIYQQGIIRDMYKRNPERGYSLVSSESFYDPYKISAFFKVGDKEYATALDSHRMNELANKLHNTINNRLRKGAIDLINPFKDSFDTLIQNVIWYIEHQHSSSDLAYLKHLRIPDTPIESFVLAQHLWDTLVKYFNDPVSMDKVFMGEYESLTKADDLMNADELADSLLVSVDMDMEYNAMTILKGYLHPDIFKDTPGNYKHYVDSLNTDTLDAAREYRGAMNRTLQRNKALDIPYASVSGFRDVQLETQKMQSANGVLLKLKSILEGAISRKDLKLGEFVKLFKQMKKKMFEEQCLLTSSMELFRLIDGDEKSLITELLFTSGFRKIISKKSDNGDYLMLVDRLMNKLNNCKKELFSVHESDDYIILQISQKPLTQVDNTAKGTKVFYTFKDSDVVYAAPSTRNVVKFRSFDKLLEDLGLAKPIDELTKSEKASIKILNEIYDNIVEGYRYIDLLTDGASRGTVGVLHRYINERTIANGFDKDVIDKSLGADFTCDERFWHDRNFDTSIIGDYEHRWKFSFDYTDFDIVHNLFKTMNEISGRTRGVHSLTDFVFNENSHCNINKLYKDFSPDEIFKAIDNNEDLVCIGLKESKDSSFGYEVVEFSINDATDVIIARERNMSVVNYDTFLELQTILNDGQISNNALKVWSKLIMLTKVGQLVNPGTWIRNLIDATIKNAGAEGSLAMSLNYEIEATMRIMKFKKIMRKAPIENMSETYYKAAGFDKIMDYYDFEHLRQFTLSDAISGGESARTRKILKQWATTQRKNRALNVAGFNTIGQDIERLEQLPYSEIESWAKKVFTDPTLEHFDDMPFERYMELMSLKQKGEMPELNSADSYYFDKISKDIVDKKVDSITDSDISKYYVFEKISGSLLNPMSQIEQIVRYSELLALEDMGYSLAGAHKEIVKTHFNYDNKPMRLKLAECVFPYATFQFNNILYWMRQIDDNPRMIRYIEDTLGTLTFDDVDEVYSDERGYVNQSKLYQVMSGAIPIGAGGMYFKLNPSYLDALNWFYGGPEEIMSKLAPPLRVTGRAFMKWAGFDSYALFSDVDIAESSEEWFKDVMDALPIAGTLNSRYYTHFFDTKNWNRVENPTAKFLVKWLPSLFGATKTYNYSYENDFEGFQKELARNGQWYDSEKGRVVDISEKNEIGLNNPNLTFEERKVLELARHQRLYDQNQGHFVTFDKYIKGGLNKDWDFSKEGEWEEYCRLKKKYFGVVYDQNTRSFVPVYKLSEGGLNADNIDWDSLCTLKEKQGLYWDSNQGMFVEKEYLTTGGLNSKNMSFPALCAYQLAIFGKKWDNSQHKFVKVQDPSVKVRFDGPYSDWDAFNQLGFNPASTEKTGLTYLNRDGMLQNTSGTYVLSNNEASNAKIFDWIVKNFSYTTGNRYRSGWASGYHYVAYPIVPSASGVRRQYKGVITNKGKAFGKSFTSSKDYAGIRMAVSGYKVYDEFYKFDYNYNYSYSHPLYNLTPKRYNYYRGSNNYIVGK